MKTLLHYAKTSLLLVLILTLSGCGTVKPVTWKAKQASFDQGEQNSGILDFQLGRLHITENAELRYEGLVGVYGKKFTPPIKVSDGLVQLPDGTWLMDKQHVEYFSTMTLWKNQGK